MRKLRRWAACGAVSCGLAGGAAPAARAGQHLEALAMSGGLVAAALCGVVLAAAAAAAMAVRARATADAPPSPAADPLDRPTLARLRAETPGAAFAALVALFARDCTDRLGHILDAAERGDAASIVRSSQELATLADTFGAARLAELAHGLAASCRDGALGEASRRIVALADTTEQTLDLLAAECRAA
jgi:hypothetical protein